MMAAWAGRFDEAVTLHEQALAIARELGERREQSYQLLGRGRAQAGMGQRPVAECDLRAARDLEVPETSYHAALALSLVIGAERPDERSASFADTVRRCEDRLGRCAELFAVRYALAVAMGGATAMTLAWADEVARGALLAPALRELERALTTCGHPGVVGMARRDLDWLSPDMPGLEPLTARLDRALSVP